MACSVGWWQSCSGCTESVDGYVSARDYPLHPKYRVQQGSGCDECKGRGVVFFPFTKADAATFLSAQSKEPAVDDDEEREHEGWRGDYNGEACVKCERLRVMLCANGMRACEKCRWSPELDGYVSSEFI